MSENEVISIKEFFSQICDHLEEKMDLQFKLNSRAVEKAEASMNERLAGMNEFRQSLADQSKEFATRKETRAIQDIMAKAAEDSKDYITRNEHSEMMNRYNEQIRQLELSKATLEGKASQKSVNLATFLAAAGLMVGFINIFVIVFRLLNGH
jgi:transketolase